MAKYYCPYCSSHNNNYLPSNNRLLLCTNCGEKLVKEPFIRVKQIVAFSLAMAFLTPLFAMIFSFTKDNPSFESEQALISNSKSFQ